MAAEHYCHNEKNVAADIDETFEEFFDALDEQEEENLQKSQNNGQTCNHQQQELLFEEKNVATPEKEQQANKEEAEKLLEELEAIESQIQDANAKISNFSDKKSSNLHNTLTEILANSIEDLDLLKLNKFPQLRQNRKRLIRFVDELSDLLESKVALEE